jgi:hypothetical protein
MSRTTHGCPCGATLRFRQDMTRESSGIRRRWQCKDCGTPIPGIVGERLSHQHPS